MLDGDADSDDGEPACHNAVEDEPMGASSERAIWQSPKRGGAADQKNNRTPDRLAKADFKITESDEKRLEDGWFGDGNIPNLATHQSNTNSSASPSPANFQQTLISIRQRLKKDEDVKTDDAPGVCAEKRIPRAFAWDRNLEVFRWRRGGPESTKSSQVSRFETRQLATSGHEEDIFAHWALHCLRSLPALAGPMPRDELDVAVIPHPHGLAAQPVKGNPVLTLVPGRANVMGVQTNKLCDNCQERIYDAKYYHCTSDCDVDLCLKCFEKLATSIEKAVIDEGRESYADAHNRCLSTVCSVETLATKIMSLPERCRDDFLTNELADMPLEEFRKMVKLIRDVANASVVHVQDVKDIRADSHFWYVIALLELLHYANEQREVRAAAKAMKLRLHMVQQTLQAQGLDTLAGLVGSEGVNGKGAFGGGASNPFASIGSALATGAPGTSTQPTSAGSTFEGAGVEQLAGADIHKALSSSSSTQNTFAVAKQSGTDAAEAVANAIRQCMSPAEFALSPSHIGASMKANQAARAQGFAHARAGR